MSDQEDRKESDISTANLESTVLTQSVHHQDGTVTFIDKRVLGGDLDQMPEGYYYSVQFVGTVIAVCCASICAYLGWVLPANTLSLINQDIGPSPNINWVATVWSLGTAVGFLLVGRLSDIFGRKWMVLGTSFLGLIGNVIGATAGSVEVLIGSSFCNGLAASGQLSFGIVLGELVPNRYRGPMVTIVFVTSLPFAVFGPIIARSLIIHTSSGWRWSYYLGIIMSAVALVLYQFLYHPPTYTQLHVQGKTKRQQLFELDYGGIALFITGMVLFLIGLSWGGTTYPWRSWQVLLTLFLGLTLLVGLGFYETYVVRQNALIPVHLFRNTGYNAIVACATIGAMVYYSLSVLWPTIIEKVYTTSSITIGWQSSAIGGGILLGQILSGISISFLPRVKFQTIVASLLAFAFVTSLASLSPSTHALLIFLGTMSCVAIGFVDNITFPGVTLVVSAEDIGVASGVLGSIRAAGGAVAQALYLSVLNNRLDVYIPRDVTPAVLAAGLPADSLSALLKSVAAGGNGSTIAGVTATIEKVGEEAVRKAYVDGFKVVFYVTIPFSAALILAACYVPNMEEYLGSGVARKLQGFKSIDKKVVEKSRALPDMEKNKRPTAEREI